MTKVLKYTLSPGLNKLELPVGAKILTVASQDNGVCLWAHIEIDINIEKEFRNVLVVGTGRDMPESTYCYIGTAFNVGGWMVRHVFEVLN